MKDELNKRMEKEEENRNLVKHLQQNPNGYCHILIFSSQTLQLLYDGIPMTMVKEEFMSCTIWPKYLLFCS